MEAVQGAHSQSPGHALRNWPEVNCGGAWLCLVQPVRRKMRQRDKKLSPLTFAKHRCDGFDDVRALKGRHEAHR